MNNYELENINNSLQELLIEIREINQHIKDQESHLGSLLDLLRVYVSHVTGVKQI